jgi:hypothetical protein
MKTSSRRAKPRSSACGKMVFFRYLLLCGHVISFCNKIRYQKDIGFLCLHSGRMYDNLILGIHTMSIWFWP